MNDGLKYLRRSLFPKSTAGKVSIAVNPLSLTAPPLFVPPGHFYSPWPDPEEALVSVVDAERHGSMAIDGIAIDDDAMLLQWQSMLPLMELAPFSTDKVAGRRYHQENDFFSYGDGLVYYAMLGLNRPEQLIEIGSGFSSALALDARDHLKLSLKLTFVDPYPKVLRSLIKPAEESHCELLAQKVQSVDLDRFRALNAGDILFIDSSHVAKSGSDVCFELFGILPALKSGVLIHIHDMFWPFEYPRAWVVTDQRAWNELHFMRAFLMYNTNFSVLFFNNYFAKRHAAEVAKAQTKFGKNSGGSLWLRKN